MDGARNCTSARWLGRDSEPAGSQVPAGFRATTTRPTFFPEKQSLSNSADLIRTLGRAARKSYSAEENIWIVMAGIWGRDRPPFAE